ncbi:MAG: MFS transporter [Myxococcales bacterium]
MSEAVAQSSAWTPLRVTVFRALFIAALVSNIGTWMHEVGAAWLMTSLTTSPLLVALLGTASNLPLFLFALPAGAVGDLVDKRKYLLFTQTWMTIVAAILGLVTLLGSMTPWLLLSLTSALGMGVAMNQPVWQAIVPEIVPREELAKAITLSGVALNVARAVGPAAAGFILAATSPGIVFLLNAASFIAVMVVLHRWERVAPESALPAEHAASAVRAGLRYVRHAPDFRAVLVRTVFFVLSASAVWALMPLVARQSLGLDSLGYGFLVGALGTGAVLMATALPRVRARLSVDQLVWISTAAFAGVAFTLAFVRVAGLVYLAMAIGGAAWISTMSSFNVASQMTSASWVRSRALAAYAIAFQGGLALGSFLWGSIASRFGISTALAIAGAGLLAGLAASHAFPLSGREDRDLSPSLHWPQPLLVPEARPADGPVLVVIEYFVAPENAERFLEAVHDLERVRRRDGGMEWDVYQDAADHTRYVETFLAESWMEHLRQHERVTVADRELEKRVRSFCIEGRRGRVLHLLHVRRPARKPVKI